MALALRVAHLPWLTCIALLAAGAVVVAGCSASHPQALRDATSTPIVVSLASGSRSTPAPGQESRSTEQPTATPIPTVAPAVDLAQRTLDGKSLASGNWSVKGVVLSFQAPAVNGAALVPQIELASVGQPFPSAVTTQGATVAVRTDIAQAEVTLKDLAPGQYKWQARFQDAETKQAGAWSVYDSGAMAFGIVSAPPSLVDLSVAGASHTVDGVAAAAEQDEPSLRWTVNADQPIALVHVAYVADHNQAAPTTPPSASATLPRDARTLSLANMDDGDWFVHLWAVDKAGQVSQPATIEVLLMRTPPQITDVLFRTWTTNPVYQEVPIRFQLSHAAKVSVTIVPATSGTVIRWYSLGKQPANQKVSVDWDGKDSHGQIVTPGSYRMLIDAVDAVGNDGQALYSGITITNKVIKISLQAQSLTAYDGDKPLLTTLVTSGGSDLPTPTGQFEIIEKASPFVFHSPFPKGSKFWYPDVKSNYAMLFDQSQADFIHDAPWRSKFGPGTNGPGVPGQVYTGSHGCVETPADVMPRLFPWSPMGTPVVITQ